MSTYDEHIAKARHNESLIALVPNGFADWRITVAFYAAVHYMEAMIVRNGRKSSDHKSRKLAIQAIPALRVAAVDYDTLANQAFVARYSADYDLNDPALTAEIFRVCALLPEIKAAIGIPPAPGDR